MKKAPAKKTAAKKAPAKKAVAKKVPAKKAPAKVAAKKAPAKKTAAKKAPAKKAPAKKTIQNSIVQVLKTALGRKTPAKRKSATNALPDFTKIVKSLGYAFPKKPASKSDPADLFDWIDFKNFFD